MCITVQIGERGKFTDVQIGERGNQRVKSMLGKFENPPDCPNKNPFTGELSICQFCSKWILIYSKESTFS